MGELLAAAVLIAGAYVGGVVHGRRMVEDKLRGAVGTKAGKCRFCGVVIEGDGLDLEAHERFYCRPPKKAGQ